LQDYIHAGGNVVRDKRGQADAQVDIKAIAELARDATHNPISFLEILLLLND